MVQHVQMSQQVSLQEQMPVTSAQEYGSHVDVIKSELAASEQEAERQQSLINDMALARCCTADANTNAKMYVFTNSSRASANMPEHAHLAIRCALLLMPPVYRHGHLRN